MGELVPGRYVLSSELAVALIEDAALPWGGFTPAGLLTLIRTGDRLALIEWMVLSGDVSALVVGRGAPRLERAFDSGAGQGSGTHPGRSAPDS
jgi:hypothetical protein